jgi:transposase InsO family protein
VRVPERVALGLLRLGIAPRERPRAGRQADGWGGGGGLQDQPPHLWLSTYLPRFTEQRPPHWSPSGRSPHARARPPEHPPPAVPGGDHPSGPGAPGGREHARPAVQGREAQRCVGGGHHLRPDGRGLAVPGPAGRPLRPPDCGLVDGRPHAHRAAPRRLEDGTEPSRSASPPPLRPRQPVHEPRLSRRTRGRRHPSEHEPQGRMPRQRGGRERVRDHQSGAGAPPEVRHARSGPCGAIRVHGGLLQPKPPALDPGLSDAGGFREANQRRPGRMKPVYEIGVGPLVDLYARRIVGWSMGDHMRTELPLDAWKMGLSRRGAPRLHHSDRGSQYTSHAYRGELEAAGTRVKHEPQGRMPRQRGGRERVRDHQSGAGAPPEVRHARRGPCGAIRVHGGLLQPKPPALDPGLSDAGGFREANQRRPGRMKPVYEIGVGPSSHTTTRRSPRPWG